MKNWKTFWQNYRLIKTVTEEDLLYQVGKTVGGEVISKEQFNADVNEIAEHLDLDEHDILLDLCCGNGVVTMQLSSSVEQAIGLDFSEAFIKNAKTFNKNSNISFQVCDITDIQAVKMYLDEYKPSKILMNDCLAYFSKQSLEELLSELSQRKLTILISSILDAEKKWKFYNTPKRKWNFIIDKYVFNQKSGLGKWWKKQTLIGIAMDYGFATKVFNHHRMNHTSHYRFNIVLHN